MFNIKWGGITAGAAFVLAFTLSLLIGQTNLLIALFRGAVFAALFFGLGLAAWSLINTFIPELLSFSGVGGTNTTANPFDASSAGTQVNITVDDEQGDDSSAAALPAALPGQEYGASGGEVDDVNSLFLIPKEDIDQTPATEYTEEGEAGDFASVTEGFSSETEGFSSAFSDVGLNDNEGNEEEESGEFSMDFSAFVPGGLSGGDDAGGTEDADAASDVDADADPFSFFGASTGGADFEEPIPERKVSGNKPKQLEGDFNAKEIAAGLRTVLQKDKK